ncbi:putative ATP-dependent helicase DinG [Peptococcaceae bacterium CEB3]|nr:putative ATP-dependent helicase DinG [Peptococcaceae bacterium CEB3]
MRISVRRLVEFLLRRGDLQTGSVGASRTLDGIRAHQQVQKAAGRRLSGKGAGGPDASDGGGHAASTYLPEVTLSYLYQEGGFDLELKGRADGIMQNEAGVCVDEIKSTTLELDRIEETYNALHWAQAQCYAFMYAIQQGLDEIGVQLTYVQLDTGDTKLFRKHFRLNELSDFVSSLIRDYLAWALRLHGWREERDASIGRLKFPFDIYRPGQRELVIAVYKTAKEGKKLFAQAPTGIGKTMATLFPALKALAEGESQTIFYLTAKTITRTVAEKALTDLKRRGLALKTLTLTAKGKTCLLPDKNCDPETCSSARGYYDRLRLAMQDMFSEESWTRFVIETYARKHNLCPFEFSLDMANWADLIICDYNYAFNPRVFLRRLFLEGGEYTFLVDEAHNLVDRAREMFSAELSQEPWRHLKWLAKGFPRLGKGIAEVNRALAKEKKRIETLKPESGAGQTQPGVQKTQPTAREIGLGLWNARASGITGWNKAEKTRPANLLKALRKFVQAAEGFLRQKAEHTPWQEEFIELYFQALGFLRTAEGYDDHYVTCWESGPADLKVKLFCLDPSCRMKEALARAKATVLFSATLSPMTYFMKVLGGEADSYKLRLDSPFPPENRLLLIDNHISTLYSRRATTYHQVAERIAAAVSGTTGNYLVFFPSYEYLRAVCQEMAGCQSMTEVVCQVPGMGEAEREDFLALFTPERKETLVGFVLMGGIFGEGIDLVGERLSGAVIVGVGLPQICRERELIRSYYQENFGRGFEFAYMYPGFNKVLQAAGRVIRTETDRGIVLLIDERFGRLTYRRLFPREWSKVDYVTDTRELEQAVRGFWK